ncbi:phosphodiester glycosidase family protein [Acidobacteriota bacterium]
MINLPRILQLVVFVFVTAGLPAWSWTGLDEGLDIQSGTYLSENKQESFDYDALRIDLARFEIRVIDARECCEGPASVRQMAKETGALAVVNGGFFDENEAPLGLIIANSRKMNELRPISWWAVFYIKKNLPAIALTRHFKHDQRITQALQSGPRLLVKGRVPGKLKHQVCRRTAVALDKSGRVILVCTRETKVSASLLGRFLGLSEKKGGLGCLDALNLDGGPSSQFYLETGGHRLHIPGGWPVPNGIGVFRKNSKPKTSPIPEPGKAKGDDIIEPIQTAPAGP